MSETMSGAELSRLLLRRGTTAAEIAAMDVEEVTKMVAYRRRKKARGVVDPVMTDEQIARAILRYAQAEPADWPVPPRRVAGIPYWELLPGALGGAAAGFASPVIVAHLRTTVPHGQEWYFVCGLLSPPGALVGAALGMVAGLVAGRAAMRVVARKWLRALVALIVGLIASIVYVGGCAWFVVVQVPMK
jgi:hypothetical protein